jgi:hypothetical protein
LTIGSPEISKLRRNEGRMETIKKIRNFKMFTPLQILGHKVKDGNTLPSREMRNRYVIVENLKGRQHLRQLYTYMS